MTVEYAPETELHFRCPYQLFGQEAIHPARKQYIEQMKPEYKQQYDIDLNKEAGETIFPRQAPMQQHSVNVRDYAISGYGRLPIVDQQNLPKHQQIDLGPKIEPYTKKLRRSCNADTVLQMQKTLQKMNPNSGRHQRRGNKAPKPNTASRKINKQQEKNKQKRSQRSPQPASNKYTNSSTRNRDQYHAGTNNIINNRSSNDRRGTQEHRHNNHTNHHNQNNGINIHVNKVNYHPPRNKKGRKFNPHQSSQNQRFSKGSDHQKVNKHNKYYKYKRYPHCWIKRIFIMGI